MRLSHVMALGSGNPSCGPTSTSDRMPRTLRVIGAQVTAVSTAIAASRVTTHTGRRPAGGPRSAQIMSPRTTTQPPCGRPGGLLPRRWRDPGGPADRRPGVVDQRPQRRRRQGQQQHRGAATRNGSFLGVRLAGPTSRQARRRVARGASHAKSVVPPGLRASCPGPGATCLCTGWGERGMGRWAGVAGSASVVLPARQWLRGLLAGDTSRLGVSTRREDRSPGFCGPLPQGSRA